MCGCDGDCSGSRQFQTPVVLAVSKYKILMSVSSLGDGFHGICDRRNRIATYASRFVISAIAFE
jgi:hypothetical protein